MRWRVDHADSSSSAQNQKLRCSTSVGVSVMPSQVRRYPGRPAAVIRFLVGASRGCLASHVVTSWIYCVYMDVGVRELKQKLSEYLDRAAGGELIRVTDRGVPKAVLGPIPGQDRIEQGIHEG